MNYSDSDFRQREYRPSPKYRSARFLHDDGSAVDEQHNATMAGLAYDTDTQTSTIDSRKSTILRAPLKPLRKAREHRLVPQLSPDVERSFGTADEQILAFYNRGLRLEEIKANMRRVFGLDVSNKYVEALIKERQKEPDVFEAPSVAECYTIGYFGVFNFLADTPNGLENTSIYYAFGLSLRGDQQLLAIQIADGGDVPNNWNHFVKDLYDRGVERFMMIISDGHPIRAESFARYYPAARHSVCMLSMIEEAKTHFDNFDRRMGIAMLEQIMNSKKAFLASQQLDNFINSTLGSRYPSIYKQWDRVWDCVIPYFAVPDEVRKFIFAANQVEPMRRMLAKRLGRKDRYVKKDDVFNETREAAKTWLRRSMRREPFWEMAVPTLSEYFGTDIFSRVATQYDY